MKRVVTVLLMVLTTYAFGQKNEHDNPINLLSGPCYVKAQNGLIVREKPDPNSKRIGKLGYGTEVSVIQLTDVELKVKDESEDIVGKWVEISETIGGQTGFVFSGYLTLEKLIRKFKIKFSDCSIHMELDAFCENENPNESDTAHIHLELEAILEGTRISVKHSKFKKLEAFLRYERSITIKDEGPHCDLIGWNQQNSEWQKLNINPRNNSFVIDPEGVHFANEFVIDINELKKVVAEQCGESWAKLIKDVKSINEYPVEVADSKTVVRIVLTDKNGTVTEKIIEFYLPMGC